MLAHRTRSGLIESRFRGAVVACDPDGEVVASWGDFDAPFFMRSAAKPFQATVSQELGAGLVPEQLAVAASSHSAEPVHLAYVSDMLASQGLAESDLVCPEHWPLGVGAKARVIAAGHVRPRRLFHNCSGKHAAMLRACLAQGWPIADYAAPEHPLQRLMGETIGEVTGEPVGPVGVDGCGVVTFRTSVTGMARAFAKLAVDDRYGEVATAMHRFPALTAGSERPELPIGVAVNGAVKGGAEGCLGVAIRGQLGLAAKAEDGSLDAAAVAMVEALRLLRLWREGVSGWDDLVAIPNYGGGRPVGALEAALAES